MKRIALIVIFVFSIFCVSQIASAYTAYISVDASLDFDMLDYIDAFVDIQDPLNNLTLNVYFNNGKDLADNPHSFTGAVPAPYMGFGKWWDIFLTNFGAEASKEDFGLGETNLEPGVVFSLSAESPFSLTIELASNDTGLLGEYTKPYFISPQDTDDGVIYSISAVPIPATAILFLSGIFGLVGIRRFKGGQGES